MLADLNRIGDEMDDCGLSKPVGLGAFPGEQTGICLLGIADGVPLIDVFKVMCGGGVVGRLGRAGACSTMVAMGDGLV